MKTAFYLPAVTPWWFDTIVAPLVRTMATEHEVHVLVPPLWRNTGIDGDQLIQFEDLPDIHWHILDGEDHPKLRFSTAGETDLVDLLARIDPQHVLCRTADRHVASVMPGIVRYITEGAAPPFPGGPGWIVLEEDMFHPGRIPALDAKLTARLDRFIDPIWRRQRAEQQRLPGWREAAGVEPDRKVVALPLEYENAENVFAQYRTFATNAEQLIAVAEMLDDDIFLAVTNHPLNMLHGDNRSLMATLDLMKGRAALVESPSRHISATEMVAADCDGAIVELSKSIAIFAMNGVPMLRQSSFPAAAWLKMIGDPALFIDGVRHGSLQGPSEADARRWFAFHFANSAFDPASVYLEAADIVDRIEHPVNPERWEANMANYARFHEELFIC